MLGSAIFIFAMLSLPQSFFDKIQSLNIPQTDRILIVSVKDQKMTLFEKGEPKAEYVIATAKNGIGQKANSFQTPLGLHRIKQKIGAGAPPYAIFESREFKGELWNPETSSVIPAVSQSSTNETSQVSGQTETNTVSSISSPTSAKAGADLITSRVMWLEGLEPGFNAGTNAENVVVDSFQRFIYIHGTNHEDDLGKPSSHGCVRMMNADVVKLFDSVEEGDLVWIQE